MVTDRDKIGIKPIVSVNKEEYDCSVISMNSSHLKVNKPLDREFSLMVL